MDADARETRAERRDARARDARDASGASTEADARLECEIFVVDDALGVDRRRRARARPPDGAVERSFSISAMFGYAQTDGGASAGAEAAAREEFDDGAMEFIAVSSARGRARGDEGDADARGRALACSVSGFGASGSARAAKVENFIAARRRATKRLAPWYEGSRARIHAMAHSRDGESLLCCTSAGGVYVVPILELTRDAEASPAMRVLASRGPKPASALWWYRALEPEREDPVVGICVGVDGEVRAWDVKEGSPLGACVVGAKCASAELARGATKQFLVINGVQGEVWTLMLEKMSRVVKTSTSEKGKVETTTKAESLPDAAGSHGFAAHLLKDEYGVREGRQVTLSVQETGESDGYSLIAALIDRRTLELYDVDRATEPKSTHALPNHTVAVHVTEDLIFALVREPVFGEEDLADLTSFTASVHVLARRFGTDGSKSFTLQTFHVPRSAGVPKKFLAAELPETYVRRRETLCGCMLWTSYGVYEIKSKVDIASTLRSFMSPNAVVASTRRDAWAPIERDEFGDNALSVDLDQDERLKLVAHVLDEDHMPVFVEAARQELKRQNFSRARDLFGKTGKPLKDFISLSLEAWEASQALTNFHGKSVEAYGGQANLSWLKTAAAAHAHLHAWCEASNAVAYNAAAHDLGESIQAKLQKLNLKEERSPEQAVKDLLRVIGEGIEATKDAGVQRDVACSASAAVVAFEAANAVSTSVISSCAANEYSDRIKTLFTMLLSSSSTVESLHMLGGVTANLMTQAAEHSGGTVRTWESKPLVFWDPNVTYYVIATQTMENLYDIVHVLGLDSDTTDTCEASPLELVYDMLTRDELRSLADMAREAKNLGVTGAAEIELTILLYLDDENALAERIEVMLEDDPKLFGWIASKCLDKRKFRITELAASQMEDFATAAMCHVAAVQELAAVGETSPSTLQAELELGVETYVARVVDTRAQVKSIEDVARCWQRNGLPIDELERLFLDVLVSQGHAEAMQVVLQSDLGFQFSGQFILAVATKRVAEDESKYSSKDGATIESVWLKIKQDLASRLDSPEFVQTRAFDAMELDSLTSVDGAQCWAFTCGHRYGSEELQREVNDAKARLKILDLPLSSMLLESDYKLQKCAVACPNCVSYAVEHYVEVRRNTRGAA